MAGLSIGLRDKRRVVDLLNREWPDVEELAGAVLDLAFQLYEAKAKYVVVGQLKDGNGKAATGPRVLDEKGKSAEDPTKFALGPYGTYGQALSAAEVTDATLKDTDAGIRTWAVALTRDSLFNHLKKHKKALEAQEGRPLVASERLALMNNWLTAEQVGLSTQQAPPTEPCWFCGTELPHPELYETPAV